MGSVDLLKSVIKEMGDNHTGSYAKSVAFSGLLALFPLLLFVLMILGIFGASGVLIDLVNNFESALPKEAYTLLTQQIIPGLTEGHKGGLTFGALITATFALWSVSGAFRELMQAANVIYSVREGRGLWAKYATSLLLSLSTAVLMIAAVGLVVGGPALAEWAAAVTGFGAALEWTWLIVQWPLLAGFVLLAFALVYCYAPDVDQPFKIITPGAGIGFVTWFVFTGMFALYVNTFGSFNKTYGTLAGVIVLLLYFYYCAYIMLMGAQINKVIDAKGEKKPLRRRVTARRPKRRLTH